MQFAVYEQNGYHGLAVNQGDGFVGRLQGDPAYPGDLDLLVVEQANFTAVAHALAGGARLDLGAVRFLPPLPHPGKIICVGLNYADHSDETGFEIPSYPTIFARFTSSLVGHGDPILLPPQSSQLDYEGELVAIIGRGGRGIPKAEALDHVAGYSIFNDATLRDYQFKTPQWTMGKNFDNTGAFGPYFVPAAAVSAGCKGLRLQTRLNGQVVQDAAIDEMVFDVASQIALLSEVFTLAPGDIIVTGTPAGVGMARKPPLWMKVGDLCEVEITGLGVLRNPIGVRS